MKTKTKIKILAGVLIVLGISFLLAIFFPSLFFLGNIEEMEIQERVKIALLPGVFGIGMGILLGVLYKNRS